MRQALKLHPDSRCDAVTTIDVEAARVVPFRLALRYVVSGTIAQLRLPSPARAERTDELWRYTCFEAFVQPRPHAAYYEINLAPSQQWATYRFTGHRAGMEAAEDIGKPRIETCAESKEYELRAALYLPEASAWRIGLSAVIEETNGRVSYWALAHAPGKPDFHHPDCFALELPSA